MVYQSETTNESSESRKESDFFKKDNVDEYNNDDDKYHILFESSTETMTLKMNNLSGKLKRISQGKKCDANICFFST